MKTKAMDGAVIEAGGDTLSHWITRETVDRMGETVVSAGMNAEAYLRNPVVLWAHDRHSLPPIGKSEGLQVEAGVGVRAVTRFAATPFAAEVKNLYDGGFLNAFSIGFIETEAINNVFTKWDLLEYSAVAVPANPDALVKAVDAGSDAAALLLRAYYPDAHDAIEASRWRSDLRRAKGALEGLRNFARHCDKVSEPLPWQPDALAEVKALMVELTGAPLLTEPTPPAEPDPPIGALSEAQLRAVMAEIVELRELAQAKRKAPDLAATVEATFARLRRSAIGGRTR